MLTTGDIYKSESRAKITLIVIGNDYTTKELYLADDFRRNSSRKIEVIKKNYYYLIIMIISDMSFLIFCNSSINHKYNIFSIEY